MVINVSECVLAHFGQASALIEESTRDPTGCSQDSTKEQRARGSEFTSRLCFCLEPFT